MKYIAPLDSRTLLQLSGADVVTFLQNLITCDVDKLASTEAAFGALLTPQGKVLFDFFLQRNDDGFLLDVNREQAESLIKRLTFYKLRAAVDIASIDASVFAVWGEGTAEGFDDPRYAPLGKRVFDSKMEANATEADWHSTRIKLGMPQSGLDFEFSSAFPHEVLMDQFGGVDFSKGCYVGQEVVSRMQHRGTARNRIVRVQASTAAQLPTAGTDIVSSDRKLGKMGSSSGADGLATIRLDRMGSAQSTGYQITADDVALQFSRPEFADYEWPNGGV